MHSSTSLHLISTHRKKNFSPENLNKKKSNPPEGSNAKKTFSSNKQTFDTKSAAKRVFVHLQQSQQWRRKE